MAKRSSSGILVAAVIWLIVAAILAAAYKFFVSPSLDKKRKNATGSESRYKEEIRIALDSFSGYSILRSDALQKRMNAQGIKVSFEDDGADYTARIEALKDGDVEMAVFTIDSLLSAGAKLGDFPASIVLVIDETKGADAMVGYSDAVSSLSDLNDASAKIVLTPASPSEFLARIAVAHFNLPNLEDPWYEEADGAEDVFKTLSRADKKAKKAYVLWEPYVSRALEQKGVQVLLDSSKLKGYIVDVLVAERDYLRDNEAQVRAFIEAYLRTVYAYQDQSKMVSLVMEDAVAAGSGRIKKDQAEKLVKGILWKNTLENYAHFGLVQQSGSGGGVSHLEDMIGKITDVLIKTGALDHDPLDGQANLLFYSKLLRDMQNDSFHPAKELNIIQGQDVPTDALGELRGTEKLPALSEAEWGKIIPVGEMKIDPISFARGTARLNIGSQRILTQLAERLKSFPHYYLMVIGQARAEGDRDANLALAASRSEAASEFLISSGLPKNRVRAQASDPTAGGGDAQTVLFVVGQRPY